MVPGFLHSNSLPPYLVDTPRKIDSYRWSLSFFSPVLGLSIRETPWLTPTDGHCLVLFCSPTFYKADSSLRRTLRCWFYQCLDFWPLAQHFYLGATVLESSYIFLQEIFIYLVYSRQTFCYYFLQLRGSRPIGGFHKWRICHIKNRKSTSHFWSMDQLLRCPCLLHLHPPSASILPL